MADDLALILPPRIDDDHGPELLAVRHGSMEDHHLPSTSSVLERGMNDELYDMLEQVRQEAFEEFMRRREDENKVIDTIRRRHRREREEAIERGEELERLRLRVDELMHDLCTCQEQKLSLESEMANSEQMIQDLIQNVCPPEGQTENYLREISELKLERDNALREVEELMKNQEEAASNALIHQLLSEFSFHKIEEATNNFDQSLKIGEGGDGIIYRGFLHHTPVVIKMFRSHSTQGPSEFQQEVNILSKLKHPNIVSLVGACSDRCVLVYEYIPNGSLEDRLSCKDNTPPLSWQTRIRIATELCSVLIFIHSCNPHMVHGDLKPANILLDANYACKLSGFGISRVFRSNLLSSNDMTQYCLTYPRDTKLYIDPEFLATGELTPESDVYSFGITLLRLLTGRPASKVRMEVLNALDNEILKDLLDPTAGNWPFVQAKQLARVAIRCCGPSSRNRPDLASEVWRLLEPMRVAFGASSSQRSSNNHHCEIPSYFVCPILQDVMQDPHIAADGHTYELESMRGWFDLGKDTSPMTNLVLPHLNLVPNHALRSAIREWQQQE